jgi:stage III sporulation protein AC
VRRKRKVDMEIDIGLVLKIAGVGVLVSVISSILTKSGKDEQAMLVTVGGIVAVMLMLVEEIALLLEKVQSIFGL